MMRRVAPAIVLASVLGFVAACAASEPEFRQARVHRHGLTICSLIITELTDGRISAEKAQEISAAIALAGNKHFGRVTCGDMWLYMAIAYMESGFKNNVVNYMNCRGMFQVHAPSWASKFGLKYSDLLDPRINADAGIRVFKHYLELYGDLVPALSAYNSDHPGAAVGYARGVLSTRNRIKKRYTELYKSFQQQDAIALGSLWL